MNDSEQLGTIDGSGSIGETLREATSVHMSDKRRTVDDVILWAHKIASAYSEEDVARRVRCELLSISEADMDLTNLGPSIDDLIVLRLNNAVGKLDSPSDQVLAAMALNGNQPSEICDALKKYGLTINEDELYILKLDIFKRLLVLIAKAG